MAFLEGLIAQLALNSDLGFLVADRTQPDPNTDQPPTYPYIIYHLIENPSDYTADVKVIRNARMQFDILGQMTDCVATSQALRRALDTFDGLFPDGTRIINCSFAGGFTSATLQDPRIMKMSQDYLFKYSDAADAL